MLCIWRFRINPSREFRVHAEAIAAKLQGAGVLAPDSSVRVVYGHGPSGMVTFEVVALDPEVNDRLVKVAEDLRTGEGTRVEVLSTDVWLTAPERDRAEGGGTPEAYDALT